MQQDGALKGSLKKPAFGQGSRLWPEEPASLARMSRLLSGQKEAGFRPEKSRLTPTPASAGFGRKSRLPSVAPKGRVRHCGDGPLGRLLVPERCHIWRFSRRLEAPRGEMQLNTLRGAQRKREAGGSRLFPCFPGRAGLHRRKKPARTYEWGRLNWEKTSKARLSGLFLT